MCAFLLRICLCQFNFQTQPGTLRGFRKTFSSSTQSLTIWSCCLRAGDVQRSARRYQSIHDLGGKKWLLFCIPNTSLRAFPWPSWTWNQAGKGVWFLLSEVQRASAKHLIVREMYCAWANLRFTHHWKRKIAANYKDPVLSCHQQFGTACFKEVKMCLCVWGWEVSFTIDFFFNDLRKR